MHPGVFIVRGTCKSGRQLTSNRSGHLHQIVNHVQIFDLRHRAGCNELTEWAAAFHDLHKIAKIVEGKMQQQGKSVNMSALQVNYDKERLGGQCPDPSTAFIAVVEIVCANQDTVTNHPSG
jgi:hypothetical protein